MLSIFNNLRTITFASTLLRLCLSFTLGALIGLERSSKNRPAGFRTHILVCVGATVASLTGHYTFLNMHMPADVSRLGAQVITGLGFIGAGTIFVTRRNAVKGLTTAAGLWATGIVGLAIGAGFYEGGILAAALILFAEVYFGNVGTRIRHAPLFQLSLQYSAKNSLDDVLRCCKDHNMTITNLQIITADKKTSLYSARISLFADSVTDAEKILVYIRNIAGIQDAQVDAWQE
ncbi:MAG: MgtC/SapB family protein [Eubacterium sp.]|nr:MgtC/SapB family protein [Eubacterium sp.]